MLPLARRGWPGRSRSGDALEARLAELDPSQEIVAYCCGPCCVHSYEAVALLRERGFHVRRLVDGPPQMAERSLKVEGN